MRDQAIDTKSKRTKKSKISRSQQSTGQVKKPKPSTASAGAEATKELAQAKTYSNGIPKNNRCTLSHKELVEFFHLVVDRVEEQRQVLFGVNENISDNDDGSNGLDDFLGSKIIDDSVNINRRDLHEKQLNRLVLVEQQIRKGEFTNICVHCSQEIEFQRLKFIPETRCCCQCKKRFG